MEKADAAGRVLVVDDNEQTRDLLARMLSQEGYQVELATDGEEAIQRAQDNPPDLILLDVVMPGLNGFEVCTRLKAQDAFRLTPIVLITGLSDAKDRVAGIQAGADDFLSKPFEQTILSARVRSLVSLKRYTDDLERAESVVFTLARAIEESDPYTRGHCDRISLYASALGERLGLSSEEIRALRRGGIVHDIGKVTVPDSVLRKNGRLTQTEREVMQQHPVSGEEICKPLRTFRNVLPIIRSHHERLDGTGYPDGLKGDEIPLTARILSVVDVFDALTSARPYREGSMPEEALTTIGEEVELGWWDPRVYREFMTMIREEGPLE